MKYLMLVVSIGYMVLVVALLVAGYHYRTDLLPFLYDNEPQQVAEQQQDTATTPDTSTDNTPAPVTTAPVTSSPTPVATPAQPSPAASASVVPEKKQTPATAKRAPQPPTQLAQRAYPAPAPAAPQQRSTPRYAPSAPAYRYRPYPQPQPAVPQNQGSATQNNAAAQRPAPRYAPPAPPKLTEEQQKTMQLTRKVQQAMWQRKFEDAVSAQKELIALHPDNPELIGQLGNMYFSQQKSKEAAAAYVEATEILINRKQIGRAMRMLSVIMQLDADSGKQLLQQLEKATGQKFNPPMMQRQQHRPMPKS